MGGNSRDGSIWVKVDLDLNLPHKVDPTLYNCGKFKGVKKWMEMITLKSLN